MALILKLLIPQKGPALIKMAKRLAGLVSAPLFCCLAIIANISLVGNGGDDCLGCKEMKHEGQQAQSPQTGPGQHLQPD